MSLPACSPPSDGFRVADAAAPRAVASPLIDGELITTLIAHGSLCPPCSHADTAQDVRPVIHGFKMDWVHAATVSAEVVEDLIGDQIAAGMRHPGDSVREDEFPFASADPTAGVGVGVRQAVADVATALGGGDLPSFNQSGTHDRIEREREDHTADITRRP